jgi:hypothetical protein
MMQLRICVQYGWTPTELKQRMSETDFQLLCLYYRVEPWGGELAQLGTGIIAATVANCRQGRRFGDKTMQPMDFMPSEQFKKKIMSRGQKPEDIEKAFRAFAAGRKDITLIEPGEKIECNL